MRKVWMLMILALLAFALPLAAQSDDNAMLRVAHFSIDAGPVDVYVNGDVALTGVDFGDMSEWMEMEAGTISVAVAPAGSSLDEAVIGPLDVNLFSGNWFTVAAIGEVGQGTQTAQVLIEDYSTIGQAEARLSVFHAISTVPPVNIFANDLEIVRLLGYPGFFGPGSDGFATVDLVAQTTDIEVRLDNGTTVLSLEDLVLGEGRNYFLAVAGTAANPQFVLVTTDQAGMMAEETEVQAEDEMQAEDEPADLGEGSLFARVAHFSAGAPEVDIYLNGESSPLTGLSFNDITDWVTLEAGIYDVAVVPAGATLDEAVFRADVPMATDSTLTLAAIGSLELGSFTVQVINEDFSETVPGEARVSVFHAIPDLPQLVTVTVTNTETDEETTLVQGLGYPGTFEGEGDGFASTDILTGTYDISVTLANGTELGSLDDLTMGQNRNYFIAVIGLEAEPLLVLDVTGIPQLLDN